MKCGDCCFYTILEPHRNSIAVCVRNPPVLWKSRYANSGPDTKFPSPEPDWWCGEWKPEGYIKIWPDNLTKEF